MHRPAGETLAVVALQQGDQLVQGDVPACLNGRQDHRSERFNLVRARIATLRFGAASALVAPSPQPGDRRRLAHLKPSRRSSARHAAVHRSDHPTIANHPHTSWTSPLASNPANTVNQISPEPGKPFDSGRWGTALVAWKRCSTDCVFQMLPHGYRSKVVEVRVAPEPIDQGVARWLLEEGL